MPRPTAARRDHDHAACIEQALRSAEAVCQQHAARLTPLRRRVLERIRRSHRPVLALEVLGRCDDCSRRSSRGGTR